MALVDELMQDHVGLDATRGALLQFNECRCISGINECIRPSTNDVVPAINLSPAHIP